MRLIGRILWNLVALPVAMVLTVIIGFLDKDDDQWEGI